MAVELISINISDRKGVSGGRMVPFPLHPVGRWLD